MTTPVNHDALSGRQEAGDFGDVLRLTQPAERVHRREASLDLVKHVTTSPLGQNRRG
jgi:hypothetical protein